MMVKSTSAILATASLLASSAMAGKPVEPVCEVVTVTETGVFVWIPDPTWSDWVPDPTATSTVTAEETWTDWVDPTTATITETASETWTDWVADPTETETCTETWSDWEETTTTTTSIPVDPTATWSDWEETTTTTVVETTTTPVTTKGHTTPAPPPPASSTTTTTTTTTTTKAPVAAATCPADNGKTVSGHGSCDCSYQVNCGVHANVGPDAKFWEEASSAGKVTSLAACLAICDNNDKCTATIWVDDPSSGDYHHCWQVSGLGTVVSGGLGQISYKSSCKGGCTASYNQ